jgi:integrase/recombinase XerD
VARGNVILLLRVKLNGQYPYLKPVWNKNHQVRDKWALVEGTPTHFPDGVYAVRYVDRGRLVQRNAGPRLDEALVEQRKQKFLLEASELGVLPQTPPLSEATELVSRSPQEKPQRLRWKDARDRYVDDIGARKSWKTADGYKFNLNLFAESCPEIEFIDQTERHHIIKFMALMEARGNGKRTQYNRVAELDTFLRFYGSKCPLAKKDWPQYVEKKVSIYSQEQMDSLLAAAEPEHALAFRFFLGSGGREQEVQYACWSDINFDLLTFKVTPKLDLGFTPKDHEERIIPLPSALMDELKIWRESNPDERLVFTNSWGQPQGHFLRILKETALQAGLNCGQCRDKKGRSCTKHPVCQTWIFHTFRKTYATWHHESGISIMTLMDWLGHSDLETTQRYLKASNYNSPKIRSSVDHTFERVCRPKPQLIA